MSPRDLFKDDLILTCTLENKVVVACRRSCMGNARPRTISGNSSLGGGCVSNLLDVFLSSCSDDTAQLMIGFLVLQPFFSGDASECYFSWYVSLCMTLSVKRSYLPRSSCVVFLAMHRAVGTPRCITRLPSGFISWGSSWRLTERTIPS